MRDKNILVTSISSKVPLLKNLSEAKNKFNPEILIYGADISVEVLGKHFVDEFWLMPNINDLDIDFFINYCSSHHIGYIIPTRDEDVRYFSSYKDILLRNSIYLFSPYIDTVNLCFDKLLFYKSNIDKNAIYTTKDIKTIRESRCVVKEQFGSGSEHIGINISKDKALKLSKTMKNPIFQPYINGKEFSVDSYVDKNNICIASIARSRDVIENGEAIVTTYLSDEGLEEQTKELVTIHKIYGHSVTQFIKSNNKNHLIECNSRFGGASTLSFKMGIESFYWFLCECNNTEIKFELNQKKFKQVRVKEDMYFEC